MQQPRLVLRRNEERRLLAGHLWVFSNEVDTTQTPLAALEAGTEVALYSSRDKFLAMACVNPHSLICARIYSYRAGAALDDALVRQRVELALQSRQAQFKQPFYRLINAEGDGLPGLVVDRFGDALAVQITTAAMEARLDDLLQVLKHVLEPNVVMLRNSNSIRQLEQLPLYDRVAHGNAVDRMPVVENELNYQIPFADGQKTGWYYDHRDSRQLLASMAAGQRVLDVCCYLGAWGINALAGGAKSVVAIDSSQAALDGAVGNVALNGFSNNWSANKGEMVAQMRALRDTDEQFDIVVLDPPAFIKRKKDRRNGVQKYQSANNLAVQLLKPGGLLVSCSCSHHLGSSDLQGIVLQAARRAGAIPQIIARRGQGRDHPVHAAIAETDYLKTFFVRMLHDT